MKAVLLTLLAAGLLLGCKNDAATTQQQTAEPSPLPAEGNPVKAEMRVLHEATQKWVTAIANNNLAAIPEGVKEVHGAREITEQALKSGRYHPPKHSADIEQFKKQDEEFHGRLVELVNVAKARDLPGATRELGRVLEGCTDCHTKYRF
jgi:cytochrome c556